MLVVRHSVRREESRRKRGRGKDLLPAEVRAARRQQHNDQREGGDVGNRQQPAYGMSFVGKSEEERDVSMRDGLVNGDSSVDGQTTAKVKTDDVLALEALIGDGTAKTSTMILPALDQHDSDDTLWSARAAPVNEDDAFRSDVASRPDSSSLADYAAVPVEEFGAALLRGMGWKEGEVVGKRKEQVSKSRIVERRPALLGIGAKEVPGGVGEEIGAWGKVAMRGKGKRRVVDKIYNPVLLRNSKTGEMVTEDELRAKKEEQVREMREQVDWRERRDRNLAIDEQRKAEKSQGRHR